MEQENINSQEVVLGNRLVECYAKKLGVLGETIDVQKLQGLRQRLAHLLVMDGNEVFELFAIQGRESKAFFREPGEFPYYFQVTREDPRIPNSRYRIVAVLGRPALRSVRRKG